MAAADEHYLELLVTPIRVCGAYRPKMGQRDKKGVDLKGFRRLYESDPFYHWFGLDNPLMYAAHKAAGGMTSVYRQIGIGVERLFRQILQDKLGLAPQQATWSYTITGANRRARALSLDARIDLLDVATPGARRRVSDWLSAACERLDVKRRVSKSLQGAVFEVRQGYKSKDSKRQNADIANAATAYTKAYLPVVAVLSTQIDEDIEYRYASEKWLVLKGTIAEGSPVDSTYAFFRKVVRFDLQNFFERNANVLRSEIDAVLTKLLSTEERG